MILIEQGHTSTRFTTWYACGLMERREKDDIEKAIRAINNVIDLQFTDPADNGTAWYWDYKKAADLPSPNPKTYPAIIYARPVK